MTQPSFPSDLLPGARVAVGQCLAVKPGDRVLVFTDSDTRVVGESLLAAARELGASVDLAVLEDFGPRPITSPPDALLAAIRAFRPTVTYYAAGSRPGEIRLRMALVALLQSEFQVRHGHMIGITPLLMRTGMLADYQQVARRTLQVYERVKDARELRATNSDGTDLVARLDPPRLHWFPWTGLYHQPNQWGNLPEGETFTCPAHVEGVLAARVIGDHFSEEYGLLDEPAMLHIDGQLRRVEHASPGLRDELWSYLDSAPNGRRVGELAIGTNEALTGLVGNLLQDEKFPGLHLAFGNPYVQFNGGDWSSPVHVDVVPVAINLWIDGEPIMSRGKFLL